MADEIIDNVEETEITPAEPIVELEKNYIENEHGKWLIGQGYKLLIEPSPEWILKNRTKSEQQIKKERKIEIQQQLDALDKSISRGLEDTLDMLVSKSIIADSDIPAYVKSRKQQKQALRTELQSLN